MTQALENIHRAADEAALDRGWGMQLESNQNQSEELQTVTYIPGGFYSSHVVCPQLTAQSCEDSVITLLVRI